MDVKAVPLSAAPPARPLVDRSDLLAVLDRAAARKVTVISAPAGSGETCLLRAWAVGRGQQNRVADLQAPRAQQFWLAVLGEIASEPSVSVNTVNTHIRNIYARLGTQNRSSAGQRARDLRLLSAGLTRS